MKILFTATEWVPERMGKLKGILLAAKKKHGDELTVVVGYTAPHVKIAITSYDMGITTEAFSVDLDSMPIEYLIKSNGVSITNLGLINYYDHVASKVDSVVAFDKKDPFIFHAKKHGKKIWFPLLDEVE